MSGSRPSSGRRWPRSPARLRTVLLVGILLPLLGLGWSAGLLVVDRWADRQASSALEREASDLGRTIDVRAALADEEIRSTVLALAADFDVAVTEVPALVEIGDRRTLEVARQRVDGLLASQPPALLATVSDDLDRLRARLDAEQAAYLEVSDAFLGINGAVESRWRAQADEIERVADRRPLPAEVRSHLRGLRETVEAFTHAGPRIRAALGLLLGTSDDADLVGLLDADVRFAAATERAETSLGPRGRAAWDEFRTDAAAQRTEATLALAIEVGLGDAEAIFGPDLELLAGGLVDGYRWALLLTELVQATSLDLEEAARAQADRDTRAVAIDVGRASILALASVAVALLLARELVGPARDLEAAARRVEQGEFEVPALEPRGPRELVATVDAFNDMTATLTAVEDHAVALSDDPDSPVLTTPLPGRTGRALQAALDRLRSSIRANEEHRAELHELATRDALTGLLNRMAAFDAIERDLARAEREGSVVMAIYVDLDGLKVLNDTCGHAAGDEAIRRTADVLAATTRRAEVVARLGGDEFLVTGVVPAGDEGLAEVRATATRLHEAITSSYVRLDDEARVRLRASLGVATSGPATDSVETLVRAADSALYDAKRAGRDQVAFHEPA